MTAMKDRERASHEEEKLFFSGAYMSRLHEIEVAAVGRSRIPVLV